MTIDVIVTVNTQQLRRELQAVQTRVLSVATKNASDQLARELAGKRGLIHRQWHRQFRAARRANFPGSIIRARRSVIVFGTGEVRQPARVVSVGDHANDLLRRVLRGTPERPMGGARDVLVAGADSTTVSGRLKGSLRNKPKVRLPRRAPRALAAVGRGGKLTFIGALKSEVPTERFHLGRALAKAPARFNRLWQKHFARELQSQQARRLARGG